MTKFDHPQEILITEWAALKDRTDLTNCTVQGVDFREQTHDWDKCRIGNTAFLGCPMDLETELQLRRIGAHVYPPPAQPLPYNPFRKALYTWQELIAPVEGKQADLHIYEHFSASKLNPPINEALWQRIHDHSIDEGLRQLLQFDEEGMTSRRCVGIMGGHSTLRTDPYFEKTALTALLLAKAGYFVVSGGGPGIMEAANLGAYLSPYGQEALKQALRTLKSAPHYTDPGYHEAAQVVLEDYPDGAENLAIPTWFYGQEPSNLFASHIAKYFSNSIREDTLLAISLYGIICAPGSAGTTQEIFMDATQNHYGTFNYYSPMVFLGRQRYEIETLIYPLLRQLAWGREYYDLLCLTDEPEEVVHFLQAHPPKKVG
jgi:predicted Rossmann-fold nucleotide-binding protein